MIFEGKDGQKIKAAEIKLSYRKFVRNNRNYIKLTYRKSRGILDMIEIISTHDRFSLKKINFRIKKDDEELGGIMRVCILFGSLRSSSNTGLLLEPFVEKLKEQGAEIDYITLKDKHIEPCTACWTCQNIFEKPGCPKDDDMNIIYEAVLNSDCIIFATPIYSWYCTPPMKAAMDRLVYGMNKYYGDSKGPCLWEGKKCALVTTCGYEIEDGAGVFEEGLRRYSKHSNLEYIGKLAVRDIDGKKYFQSKSTVEAARRFAEKVFRSL